MNFIAILVAGLIPMAVGFIWYNPKVFGNAWMRSIGADNPDKMKEGANMAKIFGLSLVFSMMMALAMGPLVIHQSGIASLLAEVPNASLDTTKLIANGNEINFSGMYRTFGHGVLHGLIFGLLMVVPIVGTSSLYERRGFQYVAISGGYWIVNMMLMGGLICAWQ